MSNDKDDEVPTPPRARAAAYVRMSDDTQNLSIEHQLAVIYEYAAAHSFEIVRVFADPGRSGLHIKGRAALQDLLSIVVSNRADFTTLLVLDVNRWGRFQDTDESAYYEYTCRRHGVHVCYCCEPFINDGSAMSSLLKGIKRLMAAEYSRELSVKVHAAQCRLTAMGFLQGGSAPLGLRRVSMSADGSRKASLTLGERKHAVTDRVILERGPDHEVEAVRKIYHWFVVDKLGDVEITRRLNAGTLACPTGRKWTKFVVRGVLTNEKYIGNIVFNLTTSRLRTPKIKNPETLWVRKAVMVPIINPELFQQALSERAERFRARTDAEMLEMLRDLYERNGRISRALIDADAETPSTTSYLTRFRSIYTAYELAGINANEAVKGRSITWRRVRNIRNLFVTRVKELANSNGHIADEGPQCDILIIDREVVVKIVVASNQTFETRHRWRIKMCCTPPADFVIVGQLDIANEVMSCVYLLPRSNFTGDYLLIKGECLSQLDAFRHASLDAVFGAAAV